MPAVDLVAGHLELTGRITTASNATFLGEIDGVTVVDPSLRKVQIARF